MSVNGCAYHLCPTARVRLESGKLSRATGNGRKWIRRSGDGFGRDGTGEKCARRGPTVRTECDVRGDGWHCTGREARSSRGVRSVGRSVGRSLRLRERGTGPIPFRGNVLYTVTTRAPINASVSTGARMHVGPLIVYSIGTGRISENVFESVLSSRELCPVSLPTWTRCMINGPRAFVKCYSRQFTHFKTFKTPPDYTHMLLKTTRVVVVFGWNCSCIEYRFSQV